MLIEMQKLKCPLVIETNRSTWRKTLRTRHLGLYRWDYLDPHSAMWIHAGFINWWLGEHRKISCALVCMYTYAFCRYINMHTKQKWATGGPGRNPVCVNNWTDGTSFGSYLHRFKKKLARTCRRTTVHV